MDVCLEHGEAAMKEGNHSAAVTSFSTWLKKQPRFGELSDEAKSVVWRRAEAQAALGHWHLAWVDICFAMPCSSAPSYLRFLARVATKVKEFPAAEDALNR